MPRMKESVSKRRYQLDAEQQLRAYGRQIGLFGGIDGKGGKSQTPLDDFIKWFNEQLNAEARNKGDALDSYIIVNDDTVGIVPPGQKARTGREEIASIYNTISKYFSDKYRIIGGRLKEVEVLNGNVYHSVNGKAEIASDAKPVHLPKMTGIVSGKSASEPGDFEVPEDMLSLIAGDSDEPNLDEILV